VSRNDELERYRVALRRRLNAEFVERWGACERGHVLTDLNRDKQGRCWCCTRAHERAFDNPTLERGAVLVRARELVDFARLHGYRVDALGKIIEDAG